MEKTMVSSRTISCLMLQLVLFLSVALSACSESESPPEKCTDALGCVTIAPEASVKIGVMQTLSGEVAPLGLAQLRGLELALDKRKDSLLGHPVVLQVEDTGCTAEGGATAALKIIADPQTVAIFGSTCSCAAAAASKAMSEAGLVMISGNNSASFLTSVAGKAAPGWHSGFFRTMPNEENGGKAAARYAYQNLGLQRAATINDNDLYSKGLVESFQKAFTELGGEIVLNTAISKGEKEMVPVLTAVINSDAQLVFFPLFQPEGSYFLRQVRAIPELNNMLLIAGGVLIEKEFLDEMGELAKGMYFVSPDCPHGKATARLTVAYERRFKEKPTVNYYLYGVDAANLLFNAIEQVAIRRKDGTIFIGRKALRDALYATTGFKGVTGILNCNRFGDCARSSFNILRLDDLSRGIDGLQSNIVFSY